VAVCNERVRKVARLDVSGGPTIAECALPTGGIQVNAWTWGVKGWLAVVFVLHSPTLLVQSASGRP
jgi:hypothetical protein